MRLYEQNIKSIVRQFLPPNVFGGIVPTVHALIEEGVQECLATPFETGTDEQLFLRAVRALELFERAIRVRYPDANVVRQRAEALLAYFDMHERVLFTYDALERWSIDVCTLLEDVLVLIDVYYS
jgi:hypothetical protein